VDSEFQKLRTCRYKVVAEYENALELPLYKSRFETENDEQVDDYWDDDSDSEICSECREQSCGNCSECDCCEGCCDCQEPEGCMADCDEPRTEIQLELNLDNKMQSVDWTKQTVSVIRLVGHLFASRRPALAMSIRREFDNYDEYTQISFETLLHHTTLDDVKRIYNELNR
jgi:hypothetical protein